MLRIAFAFATPLALALLGPAAAAQAQGENAAPPAGPLVAAPAEPEPPAAAEGEADPTPVPDASADIARLDPERLALAREIVTRAYPPETRERSFSGLMDTMIQQVMAMRSKEVDDPGLSALVDREIDWMTGQVKAVMNRHIPEIMEGTAQAYASQFTLDQLGGVRDFARTPAGQAFFQANLGIAANPYYAASLKSYMAELKGAQPLWVAKMKQDVTDYVVGQMKKGKAPGKAPVS